MAFNSLSFLVFFVIVAAAMALTNTAAVKRLLGGRLIGSRHVLLLLASYVFYGWWNWKCCLLMLMLTAVAFFSSQSCRKSRFALCAGVIFPLLVLGVFKYFNFFVESFCELFGIIRRGSLNIILPVGISFYTFQALSYIIDVHRGRIEAERSFVKVALYIAFFPQLVAGPIVKAEDFIPQLYEDRSISPANLEKGVQYFAFGLFKKIVLADNISFFVDAVFLNPIEFSGLTVLLAVLGYSIQIYCDFSGYSDMAVGCARCLGYDLPRNFNMPYISRSIRETWRRWHISLSTWLTEYLYLPLGGSRKGKARTYINLFLTMLIGGLWHGAAWTFVAWGALQGAGLCAERAWRELRPGRDRTGKSLPGIALSILTAYMYFVFCLVFFRSDSFATAICILKAIFTWQSGVTHISSWAVFGLAVTAIATAIACIRSKKLGLEQPEGFYPTVNLNSVWGLAVFFTFVGLTLGLAYTGESPFIYFQF